LRGRKRKEITPDEKREPPSGGYAYETIPGKAIIAGAIKGPDDAEPAACPKHAHSETGYARRVGGWMELGRKSGGEGGIRIA
jgi:hypothetical protein